MSAEQESVEAYIVFTYVMDGGRWKWECEFSVGNKTVIREATTKAHALKKAYEAFA